MSRRRPGGTLRRRAKQRREARREENGDQKQERQDFDPKEQPAVREIIEKHAGKGILYEEDNREGFEQDVDALVDRVAQGFGLQNDDDFKNTLREELNDRDDGANWFDSDHKLTGDEIVDAIEDSIDALIDKKIDKFSSHKIDHPEENREAFDQDVQKLVDAVADEFGLGKSQEFKDALTEQLNRRDDSERIFNFNHTLTGGEITDAIERVFDGANGLERFFEGLADFGEDIGEGLEHAAVDVGEGIGNAVEYVGEGIDEAAVVIEDGVVAIGEGIVDVAEGAGEIAVNIGEGIGEGLDDIGEGLTNIFNSPDKGPPTIDDKINALKEQRKVELEEVKDARIYDSVSNNNVDDALDRINAALEGKSIKIDLDGGLIPNETDSLTIANAVQDLAKEVLEELDMHHPALEKELAAELLERRHGSAFSGTYSVTNDEVRDALDSAARKIYGTDDFTERMAQQLQDLHGDVMDMEGVDALTYVIETLEAQKAAENDTVSPDEKPAAPEAGISDAPEADAPEAPKVDDEAPQAAVVIKPTVSV